MNLYLATPDAAEIQKVFSAVLRDSHGVEVHLEKWTAHLLAEREKRRILRYDLVVRAPGAAQPHRHQWVGKFYAQKQNGVGARAAAVLRALAATDCRVRGNMALPEVIAYDAPLGLLLLRYEEGEPVLNVLAQHRTEILSAMGRALAALHTTAVIVEPETSPATLLADLRLRVAELCTRLPGEANTFRDGLTALERRSPAAPPCLLHGDFGAGQLVWQQHRLVVLDFDKCTRGDPAFDLGNLLTQLQRIAIREPATLPDFSSVRRQVLDSYQRWTGPDPDLSERVAWYQRARLLRRIHVLACDARMHRQAEAIRLVGELRAQTDAAPAGIENINKCTGSGDTAGWC